MYDSWYPPIVFILPLVSTLLNSWAAARSIGCLATFFQMAPAEFVGSERSPKPSKPCSPSRLPAISSLSCGRAPSNSYPAANCCFKSSEAATPSAAAPDRYREAHIPGALNIPPDKIKELAPQVLPNQNAEIVTYCTNAH